MIMLPPKLRTALRFNHFARFQALREDRAEPDPVPVIKLFNPIGAATWIVTELGPDGDTLFGLADLGFGCPELGSFSLSEIGSVRLPFGLGIERDALFKSDKRLSVWTEAARRNGSIFLAEFEFRRDAATQLSRKNLRE
ncbi:DUF2958 domain-containing protein [Novosphingobium sp. G106]|uniref:DUF2958 domain-containing protein n=1 Tax=Novosphingobium sp. G106 TaxID=2849500 RepID=UPI001C2D527E|nr:DUF2958 domain-containing protein [Novosphingobium sp. G106]MBV1688992.1 DUF2958 domain-containing protein [Novosphingobium sp. G106]